MISFYALLRHRGVLYLALTGAVIFFAMSFNQHNEEIYLHPPPSTSWHAPLSNNLPTWSSSWGSSSSALEDAALEGIEVGGHGGVKAGLGTVKTGGKVERRRVLVTGGGGSIGQDLVKRMLLEGIYTITILDAKNLTSRQLTSMLPIHTSTLHPSLLRPITHSRISPYTWFSGSATGSMLTFYQGDIRDAAFVNDVLATGRTKNRGGFDGVIHLGGVARESWCKERKKECGEVNVGGTRNIINHVPQYKIDGRVPWIIYASSLEIYGKKERSVSQEDLDDVTTLHSHAPTTVLGKTKMEAEAVLRELHDTDPTSRVMILRPSLVYGSTHDIEDRLVPNLVRNALIDLPLQIVGGDDRFDFIHAEDVVETFIHAAAAMHNLIGKETWRWNEIDVVSGHIPTINELVLLIMGLSKSASPLQRFPRGSLGVGAGGAIPPSSAVADIVGYQPHIDMRDGLTRYIDLLRTQFLDYGKDYLKTRCPDSSYGDKSITLQEDEDNSRLDKLAGCKVEIGVRNGDFLHHLKCGGNAEDGDYTAVCSTDNTKVAAMNWNSSVWHVREATTGGVKGKKGKVQIWFEEEQTKFKLGVRQGKNGEAKIMLMGPKDVGVDDHTVFEPKVQKHTSYLQLLLPGTDQHVQTVPHEGHTGYTLAVPDSRSSYDFRMTMVCCPIAAPWPLLKDDFEAADIQFGTTGDIPFNSSKRLHTCQRVGQAVKRTEDLHAALSISAANGHTDQIVTPAVTSSRPIDWRLRELPPCWNDCNNPLLCVQTGSCRCVQADHCPPRWFNPIAPVFATRQTKLIKVKTTLDFVEAVQKISWKDNLLPQAARIIEAFPDLIKVHVVTGYEREEEIEAAECHKLQPTHCFSADSIMYRAMREISVPADEADLIILPVYQHCEGADFLLHDVFHHAAQTIPDLQNRQVSIVMTHDWGICINFAWEIWSARQNGILYPDPILNNVIVWSVMGDWISKCYRPHQDVVIPARTCLTEKLKERFRDLATVRPSHKRAHLMSWAGTYWGTGKNTRLRLTCPRGGDGSKELIRGAGPQSKWLDWNYMDDLGNSRFCPQPRGIAGWSTRPNDAIYAGCIPVLMADGSHYPYADIIDWSKISVRISPTELDHIEEILLAIPIQKVEEMQANLLAIRDAFIYSSDESPEDELKRKGPLFFALQSARMRMSTQYPVSEDFHEIVHDGSWKEPPHFEGIN